jgi:hypothetical protein
MNSLPKIEGLNKAKKLHEYKEAFDNNIFNIYARVISFLRHRNFVASPVQGSKLIHSTTKLTDTVTARGASQPKQENIIHLLLAFSYSNINTFQYKYRAGTRLE